MSIENAENTSMKSAEVKRKGAQEEYHFAGGIEYLPCTVIAGSREEAEEKWKAVRVPTESIEKTDTSTKKQTS